MEHSLKGYADDVSLIFCDIDVHKSVLQTIDLRATDFVLTFKPSKCIPVLFDGTKVVQKDFPLSKGSTRPITEGQTKYLGKLFDASLSATKKAASKHLINRLAYLLTATDSLPIRGEYKLWIYRNYIIISRVNNKRGECLTPYSPVTDDCTEVKWLFSCVTYRLASIFSHLTTKAIPDTRACVQLDVHVHHEEHRSVA